MIKPSIILLMFLCLYCLPSNINAEVPTKVQENMVSDNVDMDNHSNYPITLFDQIKSVAVVVGVIVGFFAIIFGFITLIFKVTENIVGNKVQTEAQSAAEKVKAEMMAFSDFSIGYEAWEVDNEKNLEKAIRHTEYAIQSAALDEKTLLQAKSNVAYFYAYKPYKHFKNRALTFAQETLEKAFVSRDRTTNFKINYGYVKLRYVENLTEASDTKAYFESLLLRKDVTLDEISEIKEYLEAAKQLVVHYQTFKIN